MATDKIQIGLRVPEELRGKLDAEASRRGVSLNKEITDRLEKSLDEGMRFSWPWSDDGGERNELNAILHVVASAMEMAGGMAAMMSTFNMDARTVWISNSVAYDQALKAALKVLEELRPRTATAPHPSMSDNVETVGIKSATSILEEAASGLSRMDNARAQKLHAGLKTLVERIAHFDPMRSENYEAPKTELRPLAFIDPGEQVGTTTALSKSTPKKGKRK
jgi:Arc-like DNA binding domain